MTEPLKRWLKKQLEALVSVQRCTLTSTAFVAMRAYEPDMTVHMWTGVHIHIYILSEPIKPRAIKSIIQTDTNHGIGTLFIVNPAILPLPDAVLPPEEWMMALHVLASERIYTYTATQDGLLAVHLEKVGITDHYRAIYDGPLMIGQIRYLRVTVRPRAIKGFWIVADFGAEMFWKNHAHKGSHYTPPPRAQYARQSPPENNRHASSPPMPGKTRIQLAYEVLGLKTDATRTEVKAAFRKQAFLLHPDVSKLEKAEAEARFKKLLEAYQYIKIVNDWG
jgi:hypothetical protein